MGWIMGDDGTHRCPPLPLLIWPRRQEGKTATCDECKKVYVVHKGKWKRSGLGSKPGSYDG